MLWDNLASAQLAQIGLVIRPEELTRTDPSRINDTQTLGGAVFACKDDTLYSVPKAHNRTTTHFLTTPIFINITDDFRINQLTALYCL